MKAYELAGWIMFAFSWLGMETIAVRVLTWIHVPNLPKDLLSPSWSWWSLILHALTFVASAALILFVLEGVREDAREK